MWEKQAISEPKKKSLPCPCPRLCPCLWGIIGDRDGVLPFTEGLCLPVACLALSCPGQPFDDNQTRGETGEASAWS